MFMNELFILFFFFQAEDGIRDLIVTGVQTCALPIFTHARTHATKSTSASAHHLIYSGSRSEERRVGKSVDLGGRRIIKKKKREKGMEDERDVKNVTYESVLCVDRDE